MKLEYGKVLIDSIEREKVGTDFFYTEKDRAILDELLDEINKFANTNFQYLAELVAFNIHGSGDIIAKYITSFSSESVKAYLIPQLVADKVKDCDRLILQLYLNFKLSDDYVPKGGAFLPAHIYTRYDYAFKKLKSKRLQDMLLNFAHAPRDVFYLPFTMRMLASWKISELKEVFLSYLFIDNITEQDLQIDQNDERNMASLAYIKRELQFTAIDGLKYYPSKEMVEIIREYTMNSDLDIRLAAKRTLKSLEKALK